MTNEALLEPIRNWLIDQSLMDCDIVELFEMTCKKMVSVGIPIARARLFWPTLHPLFRGETVLWEQGGETRLMQFEHRDVMTDEWQQSPLKFVVENNLETFRRRLTGPDALADFEVLRELQDDGFTDYLLLSTRFEGAAFRHAEGGNEMGILATFSTLSDKGFSQDAIVSLQRIQRRLAIACKTSIQSRVSVNIATTYLGERSGRYVLDGQIRHGDGNNTNAIIWFSDMRNSTMLAETMEPKEYFDLLNAFFASTAGPVVEHGGEVLDFIGDAVLAIFPFETKRELRNAAFAANKALRDAKKIAAKLNAERQAEGLMQFHYGIAINKGDVMFGNIGIPSRLTFSVISPSVNEASRIENMTKKLNEPILAAKAFAEIIPDKWECIGSHMLDGVNHETELYKFID